MLQIPRGQKSAKSQLVMNGRIERIGSMCKMMYIRQLSLKGILLPEQYEFIVNPSLEGGDVAPRFFYRMGNFTTGDPMEFAKLAASPVLEVAMKPKKPAQKIKSSVRMSFHVGPATLKVEFNMNAGRPSDHLDIEALNLGLLADASDIGGLLGTDDHLWASTKEEAGDCDHFAQMRGLFDSSHEDEAFDIPSRMMASL